MSILTKDGEWDETETEATPLVAETAETPVIPFVSREKAEKIFSSQRETTWEEKVEQINRSLGRQNDSK